MLRIHRHYIPALVLVVVVTDLGVIALALSSSQALGYPNGDGAMWPKAFVLTGVTLLALSLADLYQFDFRIRSVELTLRLVGAMLLGITADAAIGYVHPPFGLGRLSFVHTFGVIALGCLMTRLPWLARSAKRRLSRRVLVLGAGPAATALPDLQFSPTRPVTVLGFLDDAADASDRVPAGFQLLGRTEDLPRLTAELDPDLVLVALGEMRRTLPVIELVKCRLRGINVEDWTTFYEKQTGKVLVTNLRPSWLIFSDGFRKTHTTRTVKRAMDIALASTVLVVAFPVMVAVACAIKLTSRGPVLFRQQRVGEGERIFGLNKFRSMSVDAERNGPVWASAHDPRVTPIGRLLRRTRLDELPQCWNVLTGDMSFVGPRPERPEFVATLQEQIPFYICRHSVRPGITGWAQVCYPYAASVEDSLEKLQYDLYYLKNLSLLLDLIILLKTLQVVIFSKGSR